MSQVSRSFHVATYVDRRGDGRYEPLASKTLVLPAAGKEGDASEALVGHVQQFCCDGHGAGTKGCRETHAHANERIVARINPEGQVAVTWRQYHPQIAAGLAAPGQPFEAAHPDDGSRIRVEVREIAVDARPAQSDAVMSPANLLKWEAAFKSAQPGLVAERQRDQQLRDSLHQLAVEAETAITAALTAQPEDVVLGAFCAEARQTIKAELASALRELRRVGGIQPVAPAELAPARQALQAVLAPLQAAAKQDEVLRDRTTRLRGNVKQLQSDATEFAAVGGRWQGEPIADLERRCADVLAQELPKSFAERSVWVQTCEALLNATGSVIEELSTQTKQLRAERDALVRRVQALADWSNSDQAQALRQRIGDARGFPGFAARYWSAELDKVAELVQGSIGALPPLASDQPPDLAELTRLEACAAETVAPFVLRLQAEVQRRSANYFRAVSVAGREMQLPLASVSVRAVRNGSVDLDVEVRNRDAQAMVIELHGRDGTLAELRLAGGEGRAKVRLDNVVRGPFAFHITATDVGGRMQPVDVRSEALVVCLPGAVLFASPAEYRVLSKEAARV